MLQYFLVIFEELFLDERLCKRHLLYRKHLVYLCEHLGLRVFNKLLLLFLLVLYHLRHGLGKVYTLLPVQAGTIGLRIAIDSEQLVERVLTTTITSTPVNW